MLFAAGKGTRLKPLTNDLPKCLVTAGGQTLLEHNLAWLKQAGVGTVVVNVHHLGQQVIDFLTDHTLGLKIEISQEEQLLETGGGLWLARHHFKGETAFVVCNSDIYTDLDLQAMIQAHNSADNLATLAVDQRETSRYLRFNQADLLCGWENRSTGEQISWDKTAFYTRAFNGIQVLSPRIFEYLAARGLVFSTIPAYIAAARAGEQLKAYAMDGAYWIDIGTQEKLTALRAHLA